MSKSKGVYITKKKNGSVYYRASLTFKNKHISLGSYSHEKDAHQAYLFASALLIEGSYTISDYQTDFPITFDKWVVLMNYRDTGYYFKSPIYLHKNYFVYFLTPDQELTFDVDDLFYYSNHPIHRRQGYYFVNDYGMQVNLLSRYGIKNHAIEGKDFRFIDGNPLNYRYDNIDVINPYYGIELEQKNTLTHYKARIHLNGHYIIGRYSDIHMAAIAYNKAVDYVHKYKISHKNFEKNYIVHMEKEDYLELYESIKLPDSILNATPKC